MRRPAKGMRRSCSCYLRSGQCHGEGFARMDSAALGSQEWACGGDAAAARDWGRYQLDGFV
jgi:hypothetical protein